MKAEEFDRIRLLENTHWWYIGRKTLLDYLKSKLGLNNAMILDAGCGTGFAGKILSDCGTVISLDTSENAFLDDNVIANPVLASINDTPFQDNTFDLVVAMDLLEHLEDDTTAIMEIQRICKESGYVFITVPAYQCMWSAHDEALDHKRRYSLNDIVDKLKAVGFSIEKASYFVSTAFPAGFIHRMIQRKSSPSSDLAPVPWIVNTILASIMKCEAWIAWTIGLPFGMTAFVLAKKPHATHNG